MWFVCVLIDPTGLRPVFAPAMKNGVDKEYVKSVIKGLTIGHVCLGAAAVAAFVTVVVVGWTQLDFLVSWLPVVLAVAFLLVTTLLLRKDMFAREKQQSSQNH